MVSKSSAIFRQELKEHAMPGTKQDVYANDKTHIKVISRVDAFSREDEKDDSIFYSKERFVSHLDSTALKTVESLIGQLIVEEHPAILDLMASVDSHIPSNIRPVRVAGLGMNMNELESNPVLDEKIVHDLNRDPTLPFNDNSFDIVLNTVSIQYLIHPGIIFKEVARILNPGGLYLIIFSNRSFASKAIRAWELMTIDERIHLVIDYFRTSQMFRRPKTFISMGKPRPEGDKYAKEGLPSDPVFAAFADKKGPSNSRIKRPKPTDHIERPSSESIKEKTSKIKYTHRCPYCNERMHLWAITDNPMSTWDHDLYLCINDFCPYVINGWKVMYEQGNQHVTYRLCYDPKSDTLSPIPVPNLAVIKGSLRD